MKYVEKLKEIKPARKSFFAFLDVLGFSSFIKENNHEKVVEIYQCVIRSMLDVSLAEITQKISSAELFDKDFEPNLLEVPMNCFTISDSIFLSTKSDTTAELIILMFVVRNILSRMIFLGFPLRGAITHGELTLDISSVSTSQNIVHTQIFGKPLVRASELEKNQKWSGCVIDSSVVNRFSHDILSKFEKINYISKYNVPFKGEDELMYVINWVSAIQPGETLSFNENRVRESFKKHNKSTGKNINDLIENTVNFFKEMQGSANNI